jgi:hypothetical protein
METPMRLNVKENTKTNFDDIKQRDPRQIRLSNEEIGKLIARYNSGIKEKK